MGAWIAAALLASGAVGAGGAVSTPPPVVAPLPASAFRLKPVTVPTDPKLRLNDPSSMLRSGYGGSLIDLFPFEGGKFHLSGGGRLFGRAGRPRSIDPESLRYLPTNRAGSLRGGRKFRPAMLVGYGRTVEQGLAFGIDAGFVMGRIGASPDRFGRLNRRRLEAVDGRGRRNGMNQLARITALYRF